MTTPRSKTQNHSRKIVDTYKNSVQSIDFSPVEDLINDFTLRNYPFDPNTNWDSFSNTMEKLCEDENLSKYLFEQAGLIKADGNWDDRLKMAGLIQQFDVVESEAATGYHKSIEITLVSEYGYLFLDEFLTMIALSK